MRFGFLAFASIHLHASGPLRIRREFEQAGPFNFARLAINDEEIRFLHPPALKQIGKRLNRIRTSGEQQNAAGVGVEPVDVAEKFDAARPRPEIARGDGRIDGRLQIALGVLPRNRQEHPAARFVNGNDRSVLV
jgi:hypothetical protein